MKYKKTLITAGTLTTMALPLAAVISCGSSYGEGYEYYGSIQTITDAGSIADKSFNQSAFEAAKDYVQVAQGPTGKQTFGFSQPKQSTTIQMQKAYESALKAGTRTLVLPGFTHTADGDAIHFAQRMHSRYSDARYICIDGFADDSVFGKPNGTFVYKGGDGGANVILTKTPGLQAVQSISKIAYKWDMSFNHVTNQKEEGAFKGTLKKGVSDVNDINSYDWMPLFEYQSGEKAVNKSAGFYNLGFAANESGFLAAVYGGIYFNKVKNVSAPIKAWTFGGTAIPYGVSAYMDGYLAGVNWFNSNKTAGWQDIEMVFSDGNGPSKSDFTGGFDPGMATSKVQDMIMNKGVQMILPVAGPQTGDVAGVIAANKKVGEVFGFGVDTDQSKVYNPSTLLGSAVKGIYAATSYAIDALNKNPNHSIFPSFGQAMMAPSSTDPAKTYLNDLKTKLIAKYIKDGMSQKDAEFTAMVRTMPTGFAPSSVYRPAIDLNTNSVYVAALAASAIESGKWGAASGYSKSYLDVALGK